MSLGLACCLLALAPQKGIQDGWAFDDRLEPILTPGVARTMKDLGARWVRLHFRLNATHPAWDEPLLEAYEKILGTLKKEKLEVLGLVTYESHPGTQKDWIENSAEVHGGNGDNPYLRAWAGATFRRLLKRYPSVRFWEIWNEPNCWTTHPPGERDRLPGQYYLYPSNFAWLLKRAHLEASALKPARKIVSGGLLGADFTGDPVADTAIPYLRDTLKMGREKAEWGGTVPVGVWGLHLYIRSGGLVAAEDFAPFPAAFEREVNSLDPTKRSIWLTEIGWQTDKGGLSEEGQAANVRMLLEDLSKRPQYGPVFYFKLRDEPAAGLNFGLVRSDGAKKPAFDAYRSARL
ncbi:MAG TPA: hypothetical protein VGE01_09430 [Fimbriimonas sp.]